MSYTTSKKPSSVGTRITEPICFQCNNTYGYSGLSCKAYPDGIPEEILDGKIDHTKPYKGDHGIQFEEIK